MRPFLRPNVLRIFSVRGKISVSFDETGGLGMGIRIRSKYATRLFASMLAVLLLPCCVLYMVYQQFVAKQVAQEVEDIVRNEQIASMRLLDSTLESMQNKADFLCHSDGYQAYAQSGAFYTDSTGEHISLSVMGDITYIAKLNQDIEGTFVYFHQANTVIASGIHYGTIRADRFFEYYNDPMVADMQEFLTQCKSFSSLRTENMTAFGEPETVISLIYPLSKISQDHAVFCIREQVLADYFNVHSDSMKLTTLVFNNAGDLILRMGAPGPAAYFVGENQLPADGEDRSVELEGQEYLTIQCISDNTGWQAVTFIPMNSSLYSRLFDVGSFFLLFMLLTCAIGGVLIYALVYVNYSPVHQLRQKAIAANQPLQGNRPSDEFALIGGALNKLQDENTLLSATVTDNIHALRLSRLQRLLNDSYSSVEEFNTDCEQIGLSFQYPYFFVSVFLIPKDKCGSLDQIAEAICNEICKSISSRYVFSVKRDQLVFIHNVPRIEDAANLEPFYAALGLLNDQFSITSVVGVGHVHAGTTCINKSLLQAVNALDYRFVKGNGTVILFDEIRSNSDNLCPYPKQELRRLKNVVASGDYEQVQPSIDALLQYIVSHDMPTFLARSVCGDLLKELLADPRNTMMDAYPLSQMLIQLSKSETIDELVDIINTLRDNLNTQEEPSHSSENQLLREVLDYISENYCRCDFSMQEVAEHFSMLPSNMSSFFKEHMQCNMLDYLIGLRMDLAKQLLRTTTLPLKDISEQVGYYNVSSFIRRFKTHEGITPNNYRFQHSDNTEDNA